MIKPVILLGGSGTRLWPFSREKLPKQFIPIFKNLSLLDLTIERLLKVKNFSKPLIITNESYKFLVKETLKKYSIKADIILEPLGRNTSAAIYFAAKISKNNEDLIIMPSDHYIKRSDLFLDSVKKIQSIQNKDRWITFGIIPDNPSTSYGYMEIDNLNSKSSLKKVIKFIEKPPKNLAIKLLKSKKFVWNSGIFFGNSKFIIESMNEQASQIVHYCDIAFNNLTYNDIENEFTFKKNNFKAIPSEPIDKSIMEKSNNIYCYLANFGWSDIGSWDSYTKNLKTAKKYKKVFQINSNSEIITSDKRIITTIDTDDLIIVDTLDATLITKKGSSERVKELTNILKKEKVKEVKENIFENRPWGKFEIILESKEYKIKKITVNQYSRLSKQFHNFRSEHWTIIKGSAKVFLDGKYFHLKKGDSIDIPKKLVHFIENETNKILEFIEIQMGTYFGEDDIIRIDDIYNRK